MVKPETLRTLGEICESNEFAGKVLRAVCGQNVDLSQEERAMVAVIMNDSNRHTASVEMKREADAKRQAAWREKKANEDKTCKSVTSRDKPLSRGVTQGHNAESVTSRDKPLSRTQSVGQSVGQSVNQSNKPVSVPVPVRACARARESGSAGTGAGAVDLSKIDTSDEGIMSGDADYVLIAQAVTGDTGRSASAFWRKWVRQGGDAGEAEFREELFTFRRELAAGEDVRNKGAAFTARLKKRRAIK